MDFVSYIVGVATGIIVIVIFSLISAYKQVKTQKELQKYILDNLMKNTEQLDNNKKGE